MLFNCFSATVWGLLLLPVVCHYHAFPNSHILTPNRLPRTGAPLTRKVNSVIPIVRLLLTSGGISRINNLLSNSLRDEHIQLQGTTAIILPYRYIIITSILVGFFPSRLLNFINPFTALRSSSTSLVRSANCFESDLAIRWRQWRFSKLFSVNSVSYIEIRELIFESFIFSPGVDHVSGRSLLLFSRHSREKL